MDTLRQALTALSAWDPILAEAQDPPAPRPKVVALPTRKPALSLPFGSL